jgi:hypothetical protein
MNRPQPAERIVEMAEARVRKLRQLRRGTASRSSKRWYSGAIDELEKLIIELKQQEKEIVHD